MERRMKSKQGLHTRSKSFTEASAEPAVVQRQSTYDDSHTRHMNGGGTQDVWMNSFSSWKMKRIQATSQERDRKAVRDEVEETQQKLRRKKSKTFREIVEEKQSREKMLGSYVDNNGEFTEIIADLPSTNLDSDNEHENHRTPSPPRRNSTDYRRNDTDHDTHKEHKPQKSSAQPHQNYKEERDDRRKEMNTRIPEPEVITMTQSSQVHAAPPPAPARRVSPPPTASRGVPPATRSFTRAPVTRNDKGSDSTDQPLTFREKVLKAQGSEQEAQQATEAARKPYKAKRSNIFDKIRAFDTGDAFKKVVDDAVAANQKQETRVPVEEDDHEDLVIIMTQKARSYRGFGFTTSGGYDEKKPLVVAEVSSDSVADYSDLRVGDQLLSINKESTRRFNQDDVQQCLSQSILTGKLTCKVRRYPDGKVPENAASLPVNQRIHPPSQENNNPPLTRSRTLPTRDPPGKDPSLPTERTRPPVSTQRTEPTPLAGQVRPHPRATKVPSLPPTQKTQPTLLAGQAQDTRVPSVPSEQTTNQARDGMEPAHDDDGEDEDAEVDALRPGRTKNALARARQMLDELEMDDESSSKSSELTDQSPVQSSNIPLYSQPIKTDDASQSEEHNSADEERSVSSVEEEKVAEPLFQPSAPIRPLHQEPAFVQPAPFKSLPQEPKPPGMRHLIIRHAPSSSLDGGSTRTQVSSSYPRGFRSIAAPRPRGQSDPPPPARTTTTRDLASEDQPKPESDTHRRRNDFFPEEDEVDMLGRPLVEPVIAPDLDKSSSQSMPATHSINPATAHRKPFNREEERRRLERWNEEQEKRRQERYALEQQRLKEEEERALSTAAVDIQRKREQEERELEAKRLEMQRQQEELQQIRQRQMEEEENRKRAKLEQERLERERRELEVAEERQREEEKRIERERQMEEEKRRRAKLEQERREREAAEQERREMEEAERRRQEEERIERENALEEKRRKLEQERQEQEDLERKQREEEERIERKRIEEQERIKRERAQREQAAREVIRKEQEDYAAKLKERERERQEQEQARLEEAEEKKRLEEEEQQRLEIEKWRLESQERERASLQLTQAKQEGEQRLIEEERERIRAEEREKIRQEWEEERQRELEQLQMQKEQLRRERQELDRLQEQERKRLQEEKDRLKKRDELERHSPPVIEVPLSKMTNGEVMSALKQSLSSGSSPRSLGHSTGSVGHSSGSVGGHSPRSTTGYSSGSVGQSPRTMSPAAAQRTRDNNQRNMLPEKDRPHPPNHSIMSHYKDPNIPASQHWLVQEAERRRVAEQRGFDRQTPPDVIIPPHSKASPPRPAHSGYPKGFDPEVPTRIPAQRSRPPVQSQEAPANMTGVRRRMRGPEGDAERQRKMVNRRSLPDLSGGVDNATHRPAQQSTAPPSANAGRSSKQGGPPPHSIPGRGSAFQEPNKALPPPSNQAVSGKMQCCGCNKSLGRGAAMIIESLGLHFHVDCFRCCVCSIRLGNGSKGTDVRIRASQLHCQNCYSNEAGFQFTEV